jgi:hypothetical protein
MLRFCLVQNWLGSDFSRLVELGSKLGKLESDKAEAIGREDYDAAKSIKQQITRMRSGVSDPMSLSDGSRSSADARRRRSVPHHLSGRSDVQDSAATSGAGDGSSVGASEPAITQVVPQEATSAHDEQVSADSL